MRRIKCVASTQHLALTAGKPHSSSFHLRYSCMWFSFFLFFPSAKIHRLVIIVKNDFHVRWVPPVNDLMSSLYFLINDNPMTFAITVCSFLNWYFCHETLSHRLETGRWSVGSYRFLGKKHASSKWLLACWYVGIFLATVSPNTHSHCNSSPTSC